MNNETYLDFCFVREAKGNFLEEIDAILKELFSGIRLNWYLDEKKEENVEIVVAEVKGMSNWVSEEKAFSFIEENGNSTFWEYLQGYKMFIYPASYRVQRGKEEITHTEAKGCNSCGCN